MIADIVIVFMYSAKKKMAIGMRSIGMESPTSSLSASTTSNGGRFNQP